MNILYRIYFALPNFAVIGFTGKAINRILQKILKKIFDVFLPLYFKRTQEKYFYGLNNKPRQKKYIVSLTSFPGRIDDVWITIETIFRQSVKPDKIILWLGKEQFINKNIPKRLNYQIKRGLDIEFVDDLKSHKKYFYAMKLYSKDIIVTLDDDVYYPQNTLKNLIDLNSKYNDCICANRVHKIKTKNDKLIQYGKWDHNYKKIEKPSHCLMQTGVSGVLYPPNSLAKEIYDTAVFKDICFYADDIWLKIHAFRNGTKIVTNKIFNKDFIGVKATHKSRLLNYNSFNGGNNKQFEDVLNYYSIKLSDLFVEK